MIKSKQSNNIIFLEQIVQQKLRKEQELSFYEQELQKLYTKLSNLRSEINLTNLIISVITSEKDLDIAKVLHEIDTAETSVANMSKE